MPASTAAAWCWTIGKTVDGADPNSRTWNIFVDAASHAEHYFDVTYPGTETPPPGQPSVP
jgi:hypothetical protein